MKVSLISVYESITALGLRSLSANLKESGIETQMILLPRESEGLSRDGFQFNYNKRILDDIADITHDSDLVGITVMSNYFNNAAQITQFLHKYSDTPIIWGGIHPTLRPEDCLEFADMVCIGEGEDTIVELTSKMKQANDISDVKNIWLRRNGEIVKNHLRTLETNLDRYPHPDYDVRTEYVLHNDGLEPMTNELMLYYLSWPYNSQSVPTYTTMMSRGCTWSCTYCCNNALKSIYKKQWIVRRMSVAHFIDELTQIVNRFPGLECIKIEDDVFLDDYEILEEFCTNYKQRVDLPLFVTGFQPSMVTDEKINILVDAGMNQVRMGIQTGSIDTLHKVYKRPGSIDQIKRAINILHKFHKNIGAPMFDFIVDNPWETEVEKIRTVKLLLEIPRPYQILLYSLTLYPGTELFERAEREGLINGQDRQVFVKDFLCNDKTYLNGLLKLLQTQIAPNWLIKILMNKHLYSTGWVWIPYTMYKLFYGLVLFKNGIKVMVDGNWSALMKAMRRRIG